MKKKIFFAIIIFVIGEVIIFNDSRKLQCEVTKTGILSDVRLNSLKTRAVVCVGDEISAVSNLTYKNAWLRDVKIGDEVSLVVEDGSQRLYYHQIDEDTVKNRKFWLCSLRWLLYLSIIFVLIKFL